VFGTLDEGGAQRQFAGVQIRGIGGRWKRSLRCKTVSDHRVIPRFSERLGGSALIFQDLDLGLSRPKPSRERPRERASVPQRPNPLENQAPKTWSKEKCYHPREQLRIRGRNARNPRRSHEPLVRKSGLLSDGL